MPLPILTPEQRAQALAKAAEARKKRAELKGELKSGKRTLGDVLMRSTEDTVGKMKVSAVLESLPGRRQGPGPEAHGRARHLGQPSRSRTGCEAARAAPRPLQEVSRPSARGSSSSSPAPRGWARAASFVSSVAHDPEGLSLSVSVTTRAPRPGEVDGVDYFFVDDDAFDRMIRAGELLESAEIVGHRSGTPRGFVEDRLAAGRDVVLEIDVVGASQIREQVPGSVLIFIEPPSMEELERRLRGPRNRDGGADPAPARDGRVGDGAARLVRPRRRERRAGASVDAGRCYHRGIPLPVAMKR